MRELNTCTSCKFKITENKFGFLKQWDKTEIMLKTHQNKSEETAKCRFLIKYKVEVKVWVDRAHRILKVKEITNRKKREYSKEEYFKQIFSFLLWFIGGGENFVK